MSERSINDRDEDLYEHAPCGLLSISADGLVVRTNATFFKLAQLPPNALSGSRFTDHLHIASRIYFETHLAPLLRMQGFVNEVALDFVFTPGKHHPTIVNLVERRNAGGEVREIQLAVFFASDRRRYETELLEARATAKAATEEAGRLNEALQRRIGEADIAHRETESLLRQAQKMEAIGQLTGGIAHDFNNLIAGITGSLELLGLRLEQGRLESLPRYVTAARGAAKRAATLAHRLLAFSRRQDLTPMATDVNRVIHGIEDMIRRSVGAPIQLNVVGAGGLWIAMVDQNQLENAVLNLCINGRDAMPSGGRLTIETANKWLDAQAGDVRELPPGQYVAISVTDSGTGMPPEVLARAFDPFFTTKPEGSGTGLGLAMVHAFARQAGGQVRIYTEIDHGTTISIYLPRHRGPAANIEESASTTGSFKALHAETILIVDDEPTIRMLISEAMSEAGYHTVEAADGPTAMTLLETSARFDLLITDFALPGGLTGRQVAEAARLQREDLKVLFITGYADNAVIENGHAPAGARILTKPFSLDALTQAVAALLLG